MTICGEGRRRNAGGGVALDFICNGAREGEGGDGSGGCDTDGISCLDGCDCAILLFLAATYLRMSSINL